MLSGFVRNLPRRASRSIGSISSRRDWAGFIHNFLKGNSPDLLQGAASSSIRLNVDRCWRLLLLLKNLWKLATSEQSLAGAITIRRKSLIRLGQFFRLRQI